MVGLAAESTILARNPDEPGRSPYQEVRGGDLFSGTANPPLSCFGQACSLTYKFSHVPANTRLVIQSVSVSLNLSNPGFVGAPTLCSLNSVNTSFGCATFPLTAVGASWVATQQVHQYVDQGDFPTFGVGFSPTTLGAEHLSQNITLTGYYVSLP